MLKEAKASESSSSSTGSILAVKRINASKQEKARAENWSCWWAVSYTYRCQNVCTSSAQVQLSSLQALLVSVEFLLSVPLWFHLKRALFSYLLVHGSRCCRLVGCSCFVVSRFTPILVYVGLPCCGPTGGLYKTKSHAFVAFAHWYLCLSFPETRIKFFPSTSLHSSVQTDNFIHALRQTDRHLFDFYVWIWCKTWNKRCNQSLFIYIFFFTFLSEPLGGHPECHSPLHTHNTFYLYFYFFLSLKILTF